MKRVASRAYSMGFRVTFLALSAWCSLSVVWAQAPGATPLAPLEATGPGAPPAPWRAVGLPGGKVPLMAPDIVLQGAEPVLRLRSDKSYSTLSHALPAGTRESRLQWQWRLDEGLAQADLLRKEGDDVALKVCAMFDLPLANIPFVERNLLRLARTLSGENLPGATLCYVWDRLLAPGTVVSNAYSKRLRFIVLEQGPARPGTWVSHGRDLEADFLRAFGEEATTVPPLLAVVVGADSDNTGGSSLAFIKGLSLVKP